MPAAAPVPTFAVVAHLDVLGQGIRARRKALKVSATATAQAAGLSRVTLHRIEAGEASVTMGAYLNVLAALGLSFDIAPTAAADSVAAPSLPLADNIPLAQYPQLKRLAWHVRGLDSLTAREALGIYERHGRHLDEAAMAPHERALLAALRKAKPGV